MCPTFARPRLLEEAIHSFLIQDYQGEKELLILNDFDRQVLHFDHPQVTVINISRRFRTLGEKRSATVALCKYDLVAVWDDDDISLPHRLTYSWDRYDEEARLYFATKYFIVRDNAIDTIVTVASHGFSLWHRELYDEVGGYRPLDVGQDSDLKKRFVSAVGSLRLVSMPDSEIFYLRRLDGTGSYHQSRFGDTGRAHESVMKCAINQIDSGEIDEGDIELHPHWERNWADLASAYLAQGRPDTPIARPNLDVSH